MPDPFEVTTCWVPLSRSCTVTVAPDIAAPVESVTVPVTSAEFVAWPKAWPASIARRIPFPAIRTFIMPPKGYRSLRTALRPKKNLVLDADQRRSLQASCATYATVMFHTLRGTKVPKRLNRKPLSFCIAMDAKTHAIAGPICRAHLNPITRCKPWVLKADIRRVIRSELEEV